MEAAAVIGSAVEGHTIRCGNRLSHNETNDLLARCKEDADDGEVHVRKEEDMILYLSSKVERLGVLARIASTLREDGDSEDGRFEHAKDGTCKDGMEERKTLEYESFSLNHSLPRIRSVIRRGEVIQDQDRRVIRRREMRDYVDAMEHAIDKVERHAY